MTQQEIRELRMEVLRLAVEKWNACRRKRSDSACKQVLELCMSGRKVQTRTTETTA